MLSTGSCVQPDCSTHDSHHHAVRWRCARAAVWAMSHRTREMSRAGTPIESPTFGRIHRMTVATPAQTATPLELRSAALTLVAVVLKTTDLAVLAQELAERVAMTPDLF